MAWKFQKKQIDLEKAMAANTTSSFGADTTSSFGSVKHNVIVLPPPAHSNGKSTSEMKSEQSGNSSPQFSSSFPTSEQRERKMRGFVYRHAFMIMVLVLVMLVATITSIIVLLQMKSKFFHVGTEQLAPNVSSSTPLATASINSIST